MEVALPFPQNFCPGKPDHHHEESHDGNFDDHEIDDDGKANDHNGYDKSAMMRMIMGIRKVIFV